MRHEFKGPLVIISMTDGYDICDADDVIIAHADDKVWATCFVQALNEQQNFIAVIKNLLNVAHRLPGCEAKPCFVCEQNEKTINEAVELIQSLELEE